MENATRIEKLKNYLLYLLLALIPFNTHHIFNFDQIKNIEGFREHLSYSIYAFDVVFLLLVSTCIYTYKAQPDSNKEGTPVPSQAPTQVSIFFRKYFKKSTANYRLLMTLLFFTVLVISTFLSSNQATSFYATARIAEVILFFFIAKHLLKDKKVFENSVFITFFSGIAQALIAVAQFIIQKSIGLKFLGESLIASNILGVAKFELYGEKIIRAYGTFPHPNLLGAFLLLSLACGISLIKNSRLSFLTTWLLGWRRRTSSKLNLLGIGYWLLIITILGIILTFSRSVWLVAFLFLTATLFLCLLKIKDLRINLKFNLSHLTFSKILIAVTAIIFVTLLLSPRLCINNCPGDNSATLRKVYSQIALQSIKRHPLFGAGPGNFTSLVVPCNCSCGPHSWEVQPVHNLYLLIASETGLLGLVIFLLLLTIIIIPHLRLKNCLPSIVPLGGTKEGDFVRLIRNLGKSIYRSISENIFLLLFSSFLLLAFFDHYFWTLPQGQFLFWLTLALAISNKK